MKTLDLDGLIPATLTPLTEAFEVDESALRNYIRWMLRFNGLKGFAVNMDTGEGPHLTRAEKKQIVAIWKEEVKGRLPILAGVAGPSTANAVLEALDAEEAGADGVVVFSIPAYAGQPLPPDIPLEYHEAIARSVAIPMVLFQLQANLSGVIFSRETLERLLEIESVIAIKEASFDPITFVNTAEIVKKASRKITLLTGNDNFILESFLLGAEGALIGFGTIIVSEQVEMLRRVKEHNFPEALEIYRKKVRPLANAIFSEPVRNYRARLKEALKTLGVLRNSHMRPPLLGLDAVECHAVHDSLKKLGMLGA
ncbi:MAG: dihydrodipicolinate synthase family protein [Candidatus Lindowbacteria bacterium]|nr:dihydrodipicolinate synthase family protein [Candidatus Lindowbacteria bacterium]